VRYGNVLGSRGSVVPIFRKQNEMGGPLTITHPDVTRFFMTIPESVQLVIQAGAYGQGGEIFVLDMGEPVKIIDLAREMIKLSGLEPDTDIEIKTIGLRPGEKLFEELLLSGENMIASPHPKIFAARLQKIDPLWFESIMEWVESQVYSSGDDSVIRKKIFEIIGLPQSAVQPDHQMLRVNAE
jgi:FlaA1/EpsC-like NDP-sugar epimerase